MKKYPIVIMLLVFVGSSIALWHYRSTLLNPEVDVPLGRIIRVIVLIVVICGLSYIVLNIIRKK